MRVASLLLLLALGHPLDTARFRRQDDENSVDYGEYGDTGDNPECRCEGKFHCFCVRETQCLQDGSINYYGTDIVGQRALASNLVSSCPADDICCSDIRGPEVTPTNSTPNLCGVKGKQTRTDLQKGETEFGEFPWMLALYWLNGNKWEFQCGASLVGKNVALTAAHCVEDFKKDTAKLRVRAGVWNLEGDAPGRQYQEVIVKDIELHPEYSNKTLWNDIAVIVTSEGFRRTPSVNAVCLQSATNVYPPGTRCIATGWGKDVYGPTGKLKSTLRQVEVPLMPNDECQKRLRRTYLGGFYLLHDSFICAGGESKTDTCQGDGGGPLICESEGQYYQVGVVSWGIGCNVQRLPGVYAGVGPRRTWIKQTITDINKRQG